MTGAVPIQAVSRTSSGDLRHRLTLWLVALAGGIVLGYMAWAGSGYYRLPLPERPVHPLHEYLRPAGQLGLRLGIASLALFACIYLYPLRKRVRPLQRIGRTKRWLDFHVLLGLLVPVLVTLHSSLKLRGLAGMAYWIMMAIVVSGIVGRYLYNQIPRSVSAAEISLRELTEEAASYQHQLAAEPALQGLSLKQLLELPGREQVEAMSVWRVLLTITLLDLRRPFRLAALRRHFLNGRERLLTLGGLRRSGHEALERALDALREESWLLAKILFLHRAGQIFHLWHVVHRPFSYSFAVLVTAHVTLVFLMGYF